MTITQVESTIQHGIIEAPQDINQFIFAGKSIFTIKNPQSNKHFTYKVNQSKDENVFFIRLLVDADVWKYIGFIKNNNRFTPIYQHQSNEAPSSKALSFVLGCLYHKRDDLLSRVQFWHEGMCGRCGRSLTHPDSIVDGIGPVCRNLL